MTENEKKIIDEKKKILDSKRPFTRGELERLKEEFAVEYTYNSNAIENSTLTLEDTDGALIDVRCAILVRISLNQSLSPNKNIIYI